MPASPQELSLAFVCVVLAHLVGAAHAVHAMMNVRTSQGTIAWMLFLLGAPYFGVPLYWFLGRSRFQGYIRARRFGDRKLRQIARHMRASLDGSRVEPHDPFLRAITKLAEVPITCANRYDLLIDGEQTFRALFRAIEEAEDYLLVCFFIVKSDRIGTRFQQALMRKARQGVRVRLIFDEMGSFSLPRRFLRELREAGVECHSFGATRHWWSRFQLNFRNHRKVLVADGKHGFLGGLNVGDEYIDGGSEWSDWRDTHLALEGPAVQVLQLIFIEDWHWAAGEVLDNLNWTPEPVAAPHTNVVILPTGPADEQDSWLLFVILAASKAKNRLWIASPYFVPDSGCLAVLQSAAMRGVDVRILLPERADHLLVWLSGFSYYEETLPFGIRLFRFQKGFMHQKIVLIDDTDAVISSANLDNRSFRLNFEISAILTDARAAAEVAAMLEKDFAACREVLVGEITKRSFFFRALTRAARLMAPVQ